MVDKGEHPVYKKSKFSRYADKILLAYIFIGLWGANLLDAWYSGEVKQFILVAGIFLIIGLFIFLFPRVSAKHTKDRTGDLPLYLACACLLTLIIFAVQFAFDMDDGDVTADALPLTMDDLEITYDGESEYSRYQSGTIFGQECHWHHGAYNPEIEEDDDYLWSEYINYSIYTIRFNRAYDLIVQDCLTDKWYDYKEVDELAFSANKVYYSEMEKQWLLLYDDRIIEFGTSEDLTDTQLKIVAERLNDEL